VMPDMSCDRNGAVSTSKSSPVPAWNNTRRWPPGSRSLWPGCRGWPKWAWSSGLSGMETDEPSSRKVRWPRHRPTASVSGTKALTKPRRTVWNTASGSRVRAWQRAEAVKAQPAKQRDVVQGVLPLRTWMSNQ